MVAERHFTPRHLTYTPKPDAVIDAVCEACDLDRAVLLGKSRLSEHVIPRQLTFYLLWHICRLRLAQIGRLSGRDHSTVFYGIGKIERCLLTNEYGIWTEYDDTLEILIDQTPPPRDLPRHAPGTLIVADEPVEILSRVRNRVLVQFKDAPPHGFTRVCTLNATAIRFA